MTLKTELGPIVLGVTDKIMDSQPEDPEVPVVDDPVVVCGPVVEVVVLVPVVEEEVVVLAVPVVAAEPVVIEPLEPPVTWTSAQVL